jgi:hypothetical protein
MDIRKKSLFLNHSNGGLHNANSFLAHVFFQKWLLWNAIGPKGKKLRAPLTFDTNPRVRTSGLLQLQLFYLIQSKKSSIIIVHHYMCPNQYPNVLNI